MLGQATRHRISQETTRRGVHAGMLLTAACLIVTTGCQRPFSAQNGLTVFLDGAGHWGDGGDTVARGLYAAGYQGTVREFVWTTSYNPLIDQLNVAAAKRRATELADRIERFHQDHPDQEVNVIALSAGTGVATWAVEQLDNDTTIHNLVLLGSSLSYNYDMSRALKNITGRIYAYHSPHDTVLQKVRTIGTIDGRRDVDSVGLVGLTPPSNQPDRVVNTKWSRDWLRYGWTGAHSDCTKARFVRAELSRHFIDSTSTARIQTAASDTLAYHGLTALNGSASGVLASAQ